MRLPIAKYGIKELVIFAGGLLLLALAAWLYVHPLAAALPLIAAVWVVSFFRDPHRAIPADRDDLLSPADGTVADITEIDDPPYIDGPALRIGIFLSVFNVHLNRAPCAGTVEMIDYTKGAFHDARHPKAGSENESLTMGLVCAEHALKVVVRQIAGLIARRIVCRLEPGSTIGRGERYGMIKFGSRTELIIPAERVDKVLVEIGSKVHAGETVLAKITPSRSKGG